MNIGSVLRELGVASRAPAIAPDQLSTCPKTCRSSVRLSWDSSSCVWLAPPPISPVARPLPDRIAAAVRPLAAKRL